MQTNTSRGFSLIETIAYVGLFAVVMLISINMVLSVSKTFAMLRVSRDVNDTAVKIIERMTRDIHNSTSVDYVNSTFSANPSRITLNVLSASGTPATEEYYVSGGKLQLRENGVDMGSLMPSSTNLDGFVLYSVQSGQVAGVKIEVTLRGTRGGATAVRSFYNTALVRGTY